MRPHNLVLTLLISILFLMSCDTEKLDKEALIAYNAINTKLEAATKNPTSYTELSKELDTIAHTIKELISDYPQQRIAEKIVQNDTLFTSLSLSEFKELAQRVSLGAKAETDPLYCVFFLSAFPDSLDTGNTKRPDYRENIKKIYELDTLLSVAQELQENALIEEIQQAVHYHWKERDKKDDETLRPFLSLFVKLNDTTHIADLLHSIRYGYSRNWANLQTTYSNYLLKQKKKREARTVIDSMTATFLKQQNPQKGKVFAHVIPQLLTMGDTTYALHLLDSVYAIPETGVMVKKEWLRYVDREYIKLLIKAGAIEKALQELNKNDETKGLYRLIVSHYIKKGEASRAHALLMSYPHLKRELYLFIELIEYHCKTGDPEKARSYIPLLLKYEKRYNFYKYLASAYLSLSKYYLEQKEDSTSTVYLKKADSISTGKKILHNLYNDFEIARQYAHWGHIEKAIEGTAKAAVKEHEMRYPTYLFILKEYSKDHSVENVLYKVFSMKKISRIKRLTVKLLTDLLEVYEKDQRASQKLFHNALYEIINSNNTQSRSRELLELSKKYKRAGLTLTPNDKQILKKIVEEYRPVGSLF